MARNKSYSFENPNNEYTPASLNIFHQKMELMPAFVLYHKTYNNIQDSYYTNKKEITIDFMSYIQDRAQALVKKNTGNSAIYVLYSELYKELQHALETIESDNFIDFDNLTTYVSAIAALDLLDRCKTITDK